MDNTMVLRKKIINPVLSNIQKKIIILERKLLMILVMLSLKKLKC